MRRSSRVDSRAGPSPETLSFLMRPPCINVRSLRLTRFLPGGGADWHAGSRALAPGLTLAVEQVLVGHHLGQAHRAAGMQLLRADPDLGAEAELKAVGEARRRVDEHRRSIDLLTEPLGPPQVVGDD